LEPYENAICNSLKRS